MLKLYSLRLFIQAVLAETSYTETHEAVGLSA